MYGALFIVYRVYRTRISRQQQFIIITAAVLFGAASFFFVILPTFQGFDPAKLLESLTDIAYPIADTGLLILTSMIVFAFEKGRFSLTWQIFGIGLMLEAAGDLMFSYATWKGLYYPNNQFNLVSGLTDTSLNTAYLVLGLAVYSSYLVIQSFPKDKINLTLRPMSNREILIFVTLEGNIISASENLSRLTNQPPITSYAKIPLHQTLGISQSQVDTLIGETIKQETLRSQPLMNESARIIWCTSVAIYDELKTLTCIALVLRTQLDPGDQNDVPLHEDQQMLIDYYLTRTGERQAEEKQAVQTYFLEEMNLLYSLVQQFGGENAADKLLAHLQQIANQNQWNLSFHEHEISIPEEFSGRFLGNLLAAMLRQAEDFASNRINLRLVKQEINDLARRFDKDTLRDIDKYDLRSSLQTNY
ncbi:MAG TPA: hypothetical protein VLX61_16145 [Anaerolineales bacterium]|nr:hypothetical protein [Anaerolineales bacterium]